MAFMDTNNHHLLLRRGTVVSEKIIVNCRLCGKPMNVPKSIMMVFTFDPSVCNQCREKVPEGNWNTAESDWDKQAPKRPTETCQERFQRIVNAR